MDETCGIDVVHRFFPGTGPTYDHIVNLCTIGFDRLWKKKMLAMIPGGATQILDQACGTGILTFKIAQKFPHARVTGVDQSEEYIEIAREKAKSLKIDNVELILGRAEDVLLSRKVDCITSSYLAKYAELGPLTRSIGKMLRDGGTLIMHDFTYPTNRVFAPIWEIYFKLLQTAGSRKYPQWKPIFDGLPVFLRETDWVNKLTGSLREQLFSQITVRSFTLATCAIVTARKDEGAFTTH